MLSQKSINKNQRLLFRQFYAVAKLLGYSPTRLWHNIIHSRSFSNFSNSTRHALGTYFFGSRFVQNVFQSSSANIPQENFAVASLKFKLVTGERT